MAEEPQGSPPDQLQLALERTFLAHERTLMAWVRTATSLITFGFTMYKYFYYLHEQDPARHPQRLLGARTYGMLMITVGLVTLALAAWQHRQQVTHLRMQYRHAPMSLSLLVAVLIAGLGLIAIVAAAFGV